MTQETDNANTTNQDHTETTQTIERADPETALNQLIQFDAVVEDDDGTLATTIEYEDVRRIYHDTYIEASHEQIITTMTDVFDIERSNAITQLEEGVVSRTDLITYLAIDSYVDASLDPALHAMMVEILNKIDPESPVPNVVTELTDESYDSFITEHPDALVTVWKRHCDPCRSVKADLDDILAGVPSDVVVAGIDGENAASFRREAEITTAPAFIQYKNGEQSTVKTGRQSPDAIAEMFTDT